MIDRPVKFLLDSIRRSRSTANPPVSLGNGQPVRINGFARSVEVETKVLCILGIFYLAAHCALYIPVMIASSNAIGIACSMAYGCLALVALGAALRTMIINPADRNAEQTRRIGVVHHPMVNGATPARPHYCYLCRCTVGRRSKHCRLCNKCVDAFDHHNFYLNQCIGSRNYISFVTFVVAALLLLTLQIGGCVQAWAWTVVDRSTAEDVLSISVLAYVILLAVVAFFVLLLWQLALRVTLFHLRLWYRGQTTYEYCRELSTQEARRERRGCADRLCAALVCLCDPFSDFLGRPRQPEPPEPNRQSPAADFLDHMLAERRRQRAITNLRQAVAARRVQRRWRDFAARRRAAAFFALCFLTLRAEPRLPSEVRCLIHSAILRKRIDGLLCGEVDPDEDQRGGREDGWALGFFRRWWQEGAFSTVVDQVHHQVGGAQDEAAPVAPVAPVQIEIGD